MPDFSTCFLPLDGSPGSFWLWFVPLLLVLPLRSVVDSQLEGLALAAHHGAAVAHAGHHQLDAVPQQGHGGGGARRRPRR